MTQSRSDIISIVRFVGEGVAIAICRLLLLCFAIDAHSEDLPAPVAMKGSSIVRTAAPRTPIKPPLMTKSEMADAAGVVFVHVFDWYTTERFLAKGGKEAILPAALVDNSGGFIAFKLAVAGGEIAGEHYVDRLRFARQHAWFRYSAQAGQRIAIALIAKQGVDNWQYADHIRPATDASAPPQTPVSPVRFHFGGVR